VDIEAVHLLLQTSWCEKGEHGGRRRPGREGAKTNAAQRAPDKGRCSPGLLWSREIWSKVTFYSCYSLKEEKPVYLNT